MNLLAIGNYPSDTRPAHQVFVRALLLEMVSLGAEASVIAPEPLWNLARRDSGFRLAPRTETRDGISVHRPRYLTYSHVSLPVGGPTRSLSINAHVKTVRREARKLAGSFDICYGHFLYPHGLAAAEVGEAIEIPAVVSLGESSFERYGNDFDIARIGRLLERFSGVIANSPLLKDQCVESFCVKPERVHVFPNGVNEHVFYPRDRRLARRECGLPPDRIIVAFTGQLAERKGPLRVLEAVRARPEIGAIFLGAGPQKPSGAQVLHVGTVPHEQVPTWLSAADIFVLPTLAEGCSNAVLEALFCGLPIVSSDLAFNHGILDEDVAILVDPRDPRALSSAIAALAENPARREEMSRAALQRSQSYRLRDRAQAVLNFLESLVPEANTMRAASTAT